MMVWGHSAEDHGCPINCLEETEKIEMTLMLKGGSLKKPS